MTTIFVKKKKKKRLKLFKTQLCVVKRLTKKDDATPLSDSAVRTTTAVRFKPPPSRLCGIVNVSCPFAVCARVIWIILTYRNTIHGKVAATLLYFFAVSLLCRKLRSYSSPRDLPCHCKLPCLFCVPSLHTTRSSYFVIN